MWPWIFMAAFWLVAIFMMPRSYEREMARRAEWRRLVEQAHEAQRRAFYAAQGRFSSA
jgi:hypothetical protein